MTYYLLILILANGGHVHMYAYGDRALCDRAAHGQPHICKSVYYGVDR